MLRRARLANGNYLMALKRGLSETCMDGSRIFVYSNGVFSRTFSSYVNLSQAYSSSESELLSSSDISTFTT
jgi:hypothetical protein